MLSRGVLCNVSLCCNSVSFIFDKDRMGWEVGMKGPGYNASIMGVICWLYIYIYFFFWIFACVLCARGLRSLACRFVESCKGMC